MPLVVRVTEVLVRLNDVFALAKESSSAVVICQEGAVGIGGGAAAT